MRAWKRIFRHRRNFLICLEILLFLSVIKLLALNTLHQFLLNRIFKDNDVRKPLNSFGTKSLEKEEIVHDRSGNKQRLEDKILILKTNKNRKYRHEDVMLRRHFKKEPLAPNFKEKMGEDNIVKIPQNYILRRHFKKQSLARNFKMDEDNIAIMNNAEILQKYKIESAEENRLQNQTKNRRISKNKWKQEETPIKYNSKNILRKEMVNEVATETKNDLPFRLINLGTRPLLHDDLKSSESNEKFLVPNIVHYVWLSSGRDLKFHEMLGMLSAQKYIKPDYIKLHCDKEPTGIWWNMFKVNLTSLKIVHIDSDIKINGVTPTKIQVKSDIARIRILQKEGGIYIDFDVFVVQSFDDLRKYEFTLGLEYHGNPGKINNGIIIAAPNARFFKIWLDSYKDFDQDEWDEHSCIGTYLLAPKYPSLINVDENRLNYPSGKEFQLIYYNNYNWTRNYAMHLWFRKYLRNNPPITDFNPKNIKTLNSTFGQLARRILYNTTDLMKDL